MLMIFINSQHHTINTIQWFFSFSSQEHIIIKAEMWWWRFRAKSDQTIWSWVLSLSLFTARERHFPAGSAYCVFWPIFSYLFFKPNQTDYFIYPTQAHIFLAIFPNNEERTGFALLFMFSIIATHQTIQTA